MTMCISEIPSTNQDFLFQNILFSVAEVWKITPCFFSALDNKRKWKYSIEVNYQNEML